MQRLVRRRTRHRARAACARLAPMAFHLFELVAAD
jgi:hypothetical protein